jgi:hypothetical protein
VLLSQVRQIDGQRVVVAREGQMAWIVPGASSVYALAQTALSAGQRLEEEIALRGHGESIDLPLALAEGRVLLPIDHPDPAHLHLTGTGLTHLSGAFARNAIHTNRDPETLTDSMKMFRMGIEDGKPTPGGIGVQPEWFYKGNGHAAIAPESPLRSPGFALDAGEEPEVAGIYLIGPDGTPWRLGFALANEFSDHVTERGNYLWLAHSKLRPASFGPELLLGDLPAHVVGTSRILHHGQVRWEKPFVSGEDNMSHSLGNLEHHHFKYDVFRQPGDVHVHFLGTATLSFTDEIRVDHGDVFEIASPVFGLPLRNPLEQCQATHCPVQIARL